MCYFNSYLWDLILKSNLYSVLLWMCQFIGFSRFQPVLNFIFHFSLIKDQIITRLNSFKVFDWMILWMTELIFKVLSLFRKFTLIFSDHCLTSNVYLVLCSKKSAVFSSPTIFVFFSHKYLSFCLMNLWRVLNQ